MMACCDDCGVGDDIENMFSAMGDDGQTKIVCGECAKKYGLNCESTEDIASALGGKEGRFSND